METSEFAKIRLQNIYDTLKRYFVNDVVTDNPSHEYDSNFSAEDCIDEIADEIRCFFS